MLVGVWGAAGILVQHPEQSQAQYGLQREHSHGYGEVDPGRDEDGVSSMEGQYKPHVVVRENLNFKQMEECKERKSRGSERQGKERRGEERSGTCKEGRRTRPLLTVHPI